MTAGLRLPAHLRWRELIVVSLTASAGFTFALFFATSIMPAGPLLGELKLGALSTAAGPSVRDVPSPRLRRPGGLRIWCDVVALRRCRRNASATSGDNRACATAEAGVYVDAPSRRLCTTPVALQAQPVRLEVREHVVT